MLGDGGAEQSEAEPPLSERGPPPLLGEVGWDKVRQGRGRGPCGPPGPAFLFNAVCLHCRLTEVALRSTLPGLKPPLSPAHVWKQRRCPSLIPLLPPAHRNSRMLSERPEGTQDLALLPMVVGGGPSPWMWFPKLSAVAQLRATLMGGSRWRD